MQRYIDFVRKKIVMHMVQRYTHFMCKDRDTHRAEVFIVLFVCVFIVLLFAVLRRCLV